MRWLRHVSGSVVSGALLASPATALAATTPQLEVSAVKQIALRAAQFHPASTEPYQPDSRLSVAAVRLVDARRGGFVWYVRVRSTVAIFPCKLPPPGAPAPSCPPSVAHSQDALVEIGDATHRVLSFQAA